MYIGTEPIDDIVVMHLGNEISYTTILFALLYIPLPHFFLTQIINRVNYNLLTNIRHQTLFNKNQCYTLYVFLAKRSVVDLKTRNIALESIFCPNN